MCPNPSLFALLFVTLCPIAAASQEIPVAALQQRAEIRLSAEALLEAPVVRRLDLAADQRTRLRDIQTRRAAEARRILGERGNNEAAKRAVAEAGRKADAEMLAVLTPEQRRRWELIDRYSGLGLPTAAALVAVAGLTEDQRTRLRALGEQRLVRRVNAFYDVDLGGEDDGRMLKEMMDEIDRDTDAAVQRILTPEQEKQLQAALKA
jgi:hypothetical protein